MKIINYYSKITFKIILVFILLFEFFSLVTSKFNLLIFNSDPLYFKKEYLGTNLRYFDPKIGPWNKSNQKTRHKTKCFDGMRTKRRTKQSILFCSSFSFHFETKCFVLFFV